jgi:PIN domain nuclease of toxin-antitoxin system
MSPAIFRSNGWPRTRVTLLLDSHALLWALHNPEKLRPAARAAIEDPANTVFFSAGAVWELELKAAKGKLTLPPNWLEAALATGFQELPITGADAAASALLPWHHNDPFDRLFIAQAATRRWKLASRDDFAPRYNVAMLAV